MTAEITPFLPSNPWPSGVTGRRSNHGRLKTRLAATTAILVSLFSWLAKADEPLGTEYYNEDKRDAAGSTCNLSLTMTNFPKEPETAKLTLTAAIPSDSQQAFVGFFIDVGDLIVRDGKPSGYTKRSLSEGAFLSASFNSPGALFAGEAGDGGIYRGTADPAIGARLLMAFSAGDFTVTFIRKDTGTTRSYHIAGAPPSPVWHKFTDCMKASLAR